MVPSESEAPWTHNRNPCGIPRPITIDSSRPGNALASAALVAEVRQALDSILFIQAIPSADGVVVQQQDLRNRLAAHPIVWQHQRVRTPGQTMSGRSVPSQLDQVLPRFSVQKPGPYHPFGRIRIAPFGKGVLRILGESTYIFASFLRLGWPRNET